jgi:pimeloyl-ACP methyl ester carboxylesterase
VEYDLAVDEFQARLNDFKAACPERRAGDWTYRVGGQGARTLVILPGGVRLGDAAFELYAALGQHLRILAPDYPPLATLPELADGLATVLDAENLAKVDLMGSSLGGMIAQHFLRRHPQRVDRAALCATFPPNPARVALLRKQVRSLRLLPTPLLRWVMARTFRDFTNPPPEGQAFWTHYLNEVAWRRLSRADLIASPANALDFHAHSRFAPDELGDNLLLLWADNDQVVSADEREQLRLLYPRARVQELPGAGHTMFVRRPAEAGTVLYEFFFNRSTN